MISMTDNPEIAERLNQLKNSLPANVSLVAVSKTHSVEAVNSAYQAGQLDFGENRVQEMLGKWEYLSPKIRWHQIGTLQKNKVKYIVPFIHLIHSVDSPELLMIIQKEAAKVGRVIDCLIQVHIAQEETKFGFSIAEAKSFLLTLKAEQFPNVRIVGLMGMASLTEDKLQVAKEFRSLKQLFDEIKSHHASMKTLSMGMSSDYKIAIEEGSTMIRVGSAIFGSRS